MKKLQSRILAIVLVIAVAGAYMPISEVPTYAATKKVKLSKKEVNLKVGKKKTVKLKNVSKKVKWKVVKGKKVVSIKKKGKLKNKIVIKAKKAEGCRRHLPSAALYGRSRQTLLPAVRSKLAGFLSRRNTASHR